MKPSFRPYSTFARSATAVSICQGLSRIACLGATIREDFVELPPAMPGKRWRATPLGWLAESTYSEWAVFLGIGSWRTEARPARPERQGEALESDP